MNRAAFVKSAKYLLFLFLTVFLSGFLTSALGAHEHRPTNAACVLPAICTLCRETTEPPLGHDLLAADCEHPERCAVCGDEFGDPLGHDVLPADCETPSYCTACEKIFADPLGHNTVPAACETPETCTVCGKTFGEPTGHTPIPADCVKPSSCSVCHAILAPPLGHTKTEATCEEPSLCTTCGKEFSAPLGHTEVAATCETAAYCAVCEKELSGALGHNIVYATCVTDEHCTRCGKIFAYAYGHAWKTVTLTPSTCTSNGTIQHICKNCGWNYTETVYAAGHDFANAEVCLLCGYTRTYIPVDMLWQGDAYPNGCESVSTVMAMRHAGADITVDRFIDEFLPRMPYINYSGDFPTAADPEYYYLGNPRDNSGLYCFENAVANAVNGSGTGLTCTPLRGLTLEELCHTYIDNGTPVVFWGTLYMGRIVYTQIQWKIDGTENIHTLISNLHCILLTGYDDYNYYINDPLSGQRAYPKWTVEAAYADLGMRAAVIE